MESFVSTFPLNTSLSTSVFTIIDFTLSYSSGIDPLLSVLHYVYENYLTSSSKFLNINPYIKNVIASSNATVIMSKLSFLLILFSPPNNGTLLLHRDPNDCSRCDFQNMLQLS